MSRGSVKLVLACLLVLASGCSTFTPPSSSSDQNLGDFHGIYVANEDSVPHTVDVAVMHNDSLVYWTTRQLQGRDGGADSETIITPPEITNTTRTYTVLLRIDNSTDGFQYTTGDEHACYGSSVEILNDHEIRRAVTYFDASDCQPSTTATETST